MIGQMDLNGSSSINIISFTKSLNKEWHNNDEFLTWEYGKHHLKKSDTNQLKFCTFVLGGNLKHSHKENSCIKCLTCLSFFKIFFCLSWKRQRRRILKSQEVGCNHDGSGAKFIRCGHSICFTSSTCKCAVLCYKKYAVNEDRSIHHLYDSRPQTQKN